jgi:hypothetical protein
MNMVVQREITFEILPCELIVKMCASLAHTTLETVIHICASLQRSMIWKRIKFQHTCIYYRANVFL